LLPPLLSILSRHSGSRLLLPRSGSLPALRLTGRWLVLLLVLLIPAVPLFSGNDVLLDEKTIVAMEQRYGPSARTRLLAWQELMRTTTGSHRDKLERVNRFFNALPFVDDKLHWGEDDYWATPVEFLASNGGDCEDFAIAKYLTLLQLGIPDSQLALTYVKALRLNQAHMVLTYYPTPGAEPLVLDNLIPAIRWSSQRTDLLPVYSLNGTGLWLAKQRGKGKRVGNSDRLSRWQDMLQRLPKELQSSEESP
jgi:predicted transglutaminase-like cysteine proteinase